MSIPITRRGFMRSSVAVALCGSTARGATAGPPGSPVVISSGNGLPAAETAMSLIRQGRDALDAVIAGVNRVEEDPEDHSVGYGGLPNEDGVVELDACCMHGPTHAAGAVAALQGVKTPSQVARLVMQRTDHVLLVGEGARRFARAHGFTMHDLLTDPARRAWLKWKETRSDQDDWIPAEVPDGEPQSSIWNQYLFTYGTITCCALDAAGNLSGVTTTSGLSYKIPGRAGDSPIIGAGLFVDNAVGAAGSTGRGEAVIQNCGTHTVVEAMRNGHRPGDACLEALKRIADNNRHPRLRRTDGRPNFDVQFYAVDRTGRYGAAAMWSGKRFAIHNADGNRLEDCAYLFERQP